MDPTSQLHVELTYWAVHNNHTLWISWLDKLKTMVMCYFTFMFESCTNKEKLVLIYYDFISSDDLIFSAFLFRMFSNNNHFLIF